MAKNPARPTPWDRKNPRKKSGTSKGLTPAQKAEARARARAAGRRYPNLVDNMAVARAARGKKSTKQRARQSAKTSGPKTAKRRTRKTGAAKKRR
jgi:hypothetical protein